MESVRALGSVYFQSDGSAEVSRSKGIFPVYDVRDSVCRSGRARTLLGTSALLVVTRSYYSNKCLTKVTRSKF